MGKQFLQGVKKFVHSPQRAGRAGSKPAPKAPPPAAAQLFACAREQRPTTVQMVQLGQRRSVSNLETHTGIRPCSWRRLRPLARARSPIGGDSPAGTVDNESPADVAADDCPVTAHLLCQWSLREQFVQVYNNQLRLTMIRMRTNKNGLAINSVASSQSPNLQGGYSPRSTALTPSRHQELGPARGCARSKRIVALNK